MATEKQRIGTAIIAVVVFLLVVAVAEGLALFSEYEHNQFLQTYIAENSTLVLVEILGTIFTAIVLVLVAIRASRAKSTSRVGRVAHRLVSLASVFVGLFAIILWYAILDKVLGGAFIDFEAYIVAVFLMLITASMLGDRITTRMAVRNFTRRKTSMAIVIAGLMIGTAMISGALVTGDTLTELFTRGAYYGYGYADEVVYTRNATTGGYQYMPLNFSGYLSSHLKSDPSAGRYVSGVTPEVLDTVALNDTRTGFIQSGVALIGTYSNASLVLGDFHSSDKSIISPDLTATQAILNDKAARDLNATVGDTVSVYSARLLEVTVVGVAVSDARAYFSGSDNVFVSMATAQSLTRHPSEANYVAITNTGGLRDSIQYTQTVGLAANRTLNQFLQPPLGIECKADPNSSPPPSTLPCAFGEKKRAVDSATLGAQTITNFFVVLSTFAIIAGVVLIINIFVMLGEERKSEMGMARAVGMRRGQLTKLFVFEGSLYAAGAAFVGVFVGIVIAYGILYAFGTIISGVFPVNLSQVLASFTFTPQSLFTAFTEGLFITFFTILLTSWRVSRLNIIRAIRQIPEPPLATRVYSILLGLGVIMAIAGFFVFQASFAAKSAVEALVGPSLVIFGTGLAISRFLKNRLAFTLTGVALLVQWAFPPFSWNNPLIQNYDFGPELYFAGGVLMVLGGVLVVMYNTDIAIKVLRVFYQGRKTLTPIFRTALAYPENKRFRTAATVAMFSLVIFTVSAIGSIAAEQNVAVNKLVAQDSGGYDIITTTVTPVSNLTLRVLTDSHLQNKVASVIPFNTTYLPVRDVTTGEDLPPGATQIVGADAKAPQNQNFFLTNTFQMQNMTRQYKSATEVWNAVRANSTFVVWSFSIVNTRGPPRASVIPNAGDVLEVRGLVNGAPIVKQVVVAGILNGVFLDGIVANNQLLSQSLGVGTGTLSFMKVASGEDPVSVANLLRRDFVDIEMGTIVIPVILTSFLQVEQSILGLFEGFLGLGLVVGIAGLGILSVRSVVERRQEIGVLRALGFKRRMVIAAFIIENSYVALLGILIGVALGLNLGYAFAVSPNSGLTFVFPWQSILEIVLLAYGLSLLTTVNSSRRAGNIPPAEALRYFE